MKLTTLVMLTVVCLGVFIAGGQLAPNAHSDAPAEKTVRWQHMAVTHETEKGMADSALNHRIIQLGSEGWELVDVENITKDGTSTHTVYFFKRSL